MLLKGGPAVDHGQGTGQGPLTQPVLDWPIENRFVFGLVMLLVGYI